jgi:hypothetical protein
VNHCTAMQSSVATFPEAADAVHLASDSGLRGSAGMNSMRWARSARLSSPGWLAAHARR